MPANSESLTKSLEAMSRFFVGDATLGDTLQRVSPPASRSPEHAVAPAALVDAVLAAVGV